MKKICTTAFVLAFVAMLLPFVASAQCRGGNDFCTILSDLRYIINLSIGILSSLALLVFIWGIVKYIASAGNEDAKEEGKRIMIGGVIALFVLFSVFGLVRFLQRSFGVYESTTVKPPRIDFSTGGGNL